MVAWLGCFERSGRAAIPPIMFFIRSAMSGSAPPASAAPVSSPIGFTPTRRGRSCAPANATKHAQSNLRMTAACVVRSEQGGGINKKDGTTGRQASK